MRGSQRDTEFVEFVTAQRAALVRMARLLTAGDDAFGRGPRADHADRLYVHWPRVRRAGNPVGYARTSLTHAFVDEQRRAHRRRERPTDGRHGPGPRHARRRRGPRAHRAGRARHPGAAPAGSRRAPSLLDLDTAETARVLSCSTGTVKSQNAKALDRLRAELEPAITISLSSKELR